MEKIKFAYIKAYIPAVLFLIVCFVLIWLLCASTGRTTGASLLISFGAVCVVGSVLAVLDGTLHLVRKDIAGSIDLDAHDALEFAWEAYEETSYRKTARQFMDYGGSFAKFSAGIREAARMDASKKANSKRK